MYTLIENQAEMSGGSFHASAIRLQPPEETSHFGLIVALCVAALVSAPIILGWSAILLL